MVTGPYGGLGGEWFTDWWESLDGVDYHPKRPPQHINVWAGERVDMLQLLYGDYSGGHHGDQGGLLTRLRLYNGDTVTRVSGRAGVGPGAGVDQITFHTARYGHHLFDFGVILIYFVVSVAELLDPLVVKVADHLTLEIFHLKAVILPTSQEGLAEDWTRSSFIGDVPRRRTL